VHKQLISIHDRDVKSCKLFPSAPLTNLNSLPTRLLIGLVSSHSKPTKSSLSQLSATLQSLDDQEFPTQVLASNHNGDDHLSATLRVNWFYELNGCGYCRIRCLLRIRVSVTPFPDLSETAPFTFKLNPTRALV
jgi:hypothetical protein